MISVLENRCIYVYELFKRVLFQEVYLFLSEVAPASAWQVLLGETCEIHAVELHNVIAERFENAAYHTVAA